MRWWLLHLRNFRFGLLTPLFRDWVVIMMKERFGRDPARAGLGSSAFECGHLELWVVELVSNAIFARVCSPVADR
jgi:hypothetical protein